MAKSHARPVLLQEAEPETQDYTIAEVQDDEVPPSRNTMMGRWTPLYQDLMAHLGEWRKITFASPEDARRAESSLRIRLMAHDATLRLNCRARGSVAFLRMEARA